MTGELSGSDILTLLAEGKEEKGDEPKLSRDELMALFTNDDVEQIRRPPTYQEEVAMLPKASREQLARQNMYQSQEKDNSAPVVSDATLYDPSVGESRGGDFGRGMGLSAFETYKGVKNLVGFESSPAEEEALKMWRSDVANSGGFGTAGRVAGELGQLAIPVSQVNKLKNLPKVGKYMSPLAADIGITAGHGYVKAPGEGKTRGREAAESALWALAGGAGGAGLNKAVQGFERSDAAKYLLNEGVDNITAGRAAKSSLPQALEFAMGVFPFTAKGIKEIQDEALDKWSGVVLNKAAPSGKAITEIGTKGNKQLADAFNDAYLDAWKLGGKPSNEGMVATINEGVEAARILGGSSELALKRVLKDVHNISKNYSPKNVKELDNTLRTKIKHAAKSGNNELATTMKNMRKTLRNSVGPETQAALKAVDSHYGDYLAVRKAGSSAKGVRGEGVVHPDVMVGATKKVGGETRTFKGESPLYDFTVAGTETVARKDPGVIYNMLRGLATKAWSPTSALRAGSRATLGDTAVQKAAQKVYDPLTEALRKKGITGRTLGAAYEE